MRLPQSTKSSDRKGPTKEFGSVAQLVEQRTFNPTVAGSNPVTSTN